MPRFFISGDAVSDGRCVIEGEDYHHLVRVRRTRPGDVLVLNTPDGMVLNARVTKISGSALYAEIIDKKSAEPLSLNISLYLSLLKGRKFETVIQKTVELGVRRIVPVVSERSIPDIEGKEDRRLDRWRKIAAEAAKQCLRSDEPALEPPTPFAEAVLSGPGGRRLIAHPAGGAPLPGALRHRMEVSRDTHLLVGPEGGFTDEELALAAGCGWEKIHFGFTQLRAETAAIVLPAILIYEWSCIHEYNG
ncbi:MAG TPA: 16S rRNA (uracil(1498)-N(3))-methyltransferase [Spirochaetes bacterium]|nr:16S rRNA (uracil(1498)-N(3))-methyltransferase [Spirochaetota bacterium]